MKKSLVLFMALGLFVAACNNKKNDKTQNTNNREKDDYGKNENMNTGENKENKTETNSKYNWSASDINSFNEKCLSTVNNNTEVARTFCPCLLEKFQAKYMSLEDMDRSATEEEGRLAGEACKTLINENANNNKTVSHWSGSDEEKWMQACSPALVSKFGETKANNYCRCVLEKLKEEYSSYDDLEMRGTKEKGEELGKQCANELKGGNQ